MMMESYFIDNGLAIFGGSKPSRDVRERLGSFGVTATLPNGRGSAWVLYSFLNATTASGGNVTAIECGRLCFAIARDETQPPLPAFVPPNNSESVFRISR